MNAAFFLLSAVYYLGTVYVAVTAKVKDSPLIRLTNFLDFAAKDKAVLPVHVSLSNEWMLFIFYALSGLAMVFLVQLVPSRQLKEEERIEQIFRSKPVRCKPEMLQNLFRNKVKPPFLDKMKPPQKKKLELSDVMDFLGSKVKAFYGRGHITREDYHTETFGHVSKPQHVRLTISEGLYKNKVATLVGLATMLGLLLWAVMPIQRFYQEFTPLPDTFVMILTVYSLDILLVLLVILYYRFVGKNIGAKVDIRFRPANQPGESPRTRYIVQTSLKRNEWEEDEKDEKDETYEWLRKITKKDLEEKLKVKENWITIKCLARPRARKG